MIHFPDAGTGGVQMPLVVIHQLAAAHHVRGLDPEDAAIGEAATAVIVIAKAALVGGPKVVSITHEGVAGQHVIGIGADDGADAGERIAAHSRLDLALGGHDAAQDGVLVRFHSGGEAQILLFLGHAEGVENVVQYGAAVSIQHDALDGTQAVKLQRHVQIALEGGELVVDDTFHRHRLRGAKGPHVLQVFRGQCVGLGQVRAAQDFGFTLFGLSGHILRIGVTRRIRNQDDAAALAVEGHVRGRQTVCLEHAAETQGHQGQLVDGIGHLDHGKRIRPVKHRLPPPRWRGWQSPGYAGPARLHPF